MKTFATLAQPQNYVTSKIDHHRSPIVLDQQAIKTWFDITKNLMSVFDSICQSDVYHWNARELDPAIKSPKNKSIDVLKPIGPPLVDYKKIIQKKQLVFKPVKRRKKK